MNLKNHNDPIPDKTSWLWTVFFIYLLTLAFSISRHELWGDEVHSWNIAKNSAGIFDLISNTRFEGHPPVWYVLLFILSKFTHDPLGMQYLQFGICACIAFIFLFRAPLQLSYKITVLFGYYFLYEYGVFSRNYAIAVLFALLVSLTLRKEFKFNNLKYYVLLFFLSNTHFLALIMAISFHIYFLASFSKKEKTKLLIHSLTGIVILIPAFYFIFPPASSDLNTDFWLRIWNKDQIYTALQAPLKSLAPIPAWWEYHFWNKHAVLQAQKTHAFLKFLSPFLSLGLVATLVFILKPHKKALIFFLSNLILTWGFALIFPLTTFRYTGFIFIGFVMSLVLVDDLQLETKFKQTLFYLILLFQCLGAFIALSKDYRYPFSHANEIKSISKMVPKDKAIITDYWCLNYLSAFLDRPFYCVGFNKEKSFLLWDKEHTKVLKNKSVYTEGTTIFFKSHSDKEIYFISNTPMKDINSRDSLFFKTFKVQFITGQYDAIEDYSNIYLYKISRK